MHLQTLIDAWNTFFHASESCAPQVLFRLLFGGLLLLNAVLLTPLVTEFYGVDSMWSLAAWQRYQGKGRLSLLHLMPPTTGSFRVLMLIHVASSIAFLLGWQFRVASVIVFVTLVSIHHRNTFILSSGDTLLRMLCFFAMFSSAADAFSIDAWQKGTTGVPKVAPWPLRLMQLQISVVYLRTVAWKLRGTKWWDGTAAWYPIWVDTYLRNRPPGWMLSLPMIRIATWGTLVEELALGTLIWVREFRPYVMLFGILLHLVFEFILNLQLFGWIMIAGLLLFIDPQFIEAWF